VLFMTRRAKLEEEEKAEEEEASDVQFILY
jgi:hypothetical protein